MEPKKWRRLRLFTFATYLLHRILCGIERTINAATLWIYVSTIMKTDQPRLYYGLIISAFFLPSIFIAPIVTRYTDKNRRVKRVLILCNFFAMAGCIMYVIPSSPFFAMTGRFLQGFLNVPRALITAETVRSYPESEMTKKLPSLSTASTLGDILGPIFVAGFLNVNFKLGNLPISYGNVSGVVLLVMVAFLQIGTILFVTDLSRTYDMKASLQDSKDQQENPSDVGKVSKEDLKENSIDLLKKILRCPDMLLLLLLTGFSFFVSLSLNRIIPISIISNLGYSYYALNIAIVGRSICKILFLILLVSMRLSFKNLNLCAILSLVALIITATCQLLLDYGHFNLYVNIITLTIWTISLTIFEVGENFFISVSTCKMTSSDNQAFVEGIRLCVKHSFFLFAASTSGLLATETDYYSTAIILITISLLIWLVARRKQFQDPKPIF